MACHYSRASRFCKLHCFFGLTDLKPYTGLSFKLSLTFPPTYPYTAPHVTFITPMYHPNIDMSGNICLDILKEEWSAVYNVQTILLSIQSMLAEPNPKSPLNAQYDPFLHLTHSFQSCNVVERQQNGRVQTACYGSVQSQIWLAAVRSLAIVGTLHLSLCFERFILSCFAVALWIMAWIGQSLGLDGDCNKGWLTLPELSNF